MRVIDVEYGSDDWSEMRVPKACASESAVVAGGVYKYMTRKELLDLKKGGKPAPVDAAKKQLFNRGHQAEEWARPIFEEQNLCDCPAVVGEVEIEGITFLASFDGIRSDNGKPWEHKLWNQTLAENVRNGVLEPLHYWQCEHQMIVAECEDMDFTVSDGTVNNSESMVYVSVPERRAELIASWKQFYIDLETHEIEAKVEPVQAGEAASFPVITCQVDGAMITSNLSDCLVAVKDLAEKESRKLLLTDQDFINKEQFNKTVKTTRSSLKNEVSRIKQNFSTLADFEGVAKELDSVLQKLQSAGERQVKDDKEKRKREIADKAMLACKDHVKAADETIKPLKIISVCTTTLSPDFEDAMKGMKNKDKMQAAVDGAVAAYKIEINNVVLQVTLNLKYMRETAEDHRHLFADLANFINQESEPFQVIVKTRITEDKIREADRLEKQKEKIQRDEDSIAKAAAEVKQMQEPAPVQATTAEPETVEPDPCADIALLATTEFQSGYLRCMDDFSYMLEGETVVGGHPFKPVSLQTATRTFLNRCALTGE